MAKLENYIIHCASTPPTMIVDEAKLDHWHMAPRKNADGTYTYLGKTYKNLSEANLKPQHVGKIGRGWDRYGYCKIIHRDGSKTVLVNIDGDDYISNDEMTWGAVGKNASSVHICLEGGLLSGGKKPKKLLDFFELFTDEQFYALTEDIRNFVSKHPKVKVSGHQKYSSKLCPGFDVEYFLTSIGLTELI